MLDSTAALLIIRYAELRSTREAYDAAEKPPPEAMACHTNRPAPVALSSTPLHSFISHQPGVAGAARLVSAAS